MKDLGGGTQTMGNSGEDWFYDIKNSFKDGKHYGFISAGYSTFPQLTGTTGCSNIDLGDYLTNEMDIPNVWNHRADHCKLALTDTKGKLLWYKTYPNLPNKVTQSGRFYSVIQTPDGGYIACGGTRYVDGIKFNPDNSFPNGRSMSCHNDKKSYIVKTDINGNVVWQYYYTYSDNKLDAEWTNGSGYCIIPKGNTGNFIVVLAEGYYSSTPSMVVMEINNLGQIVARNSITNLSGYTATGTVQYIRGRSILYEAATGNYFISGTLKHQSPAPKGDKGVAFVMKLDASLNQIACLNKNGGYESINNRSYDNLGFDLAWFTTSPPTFIASFLINGVDAACCENGSGTAIGAIEKINTSLTILTTVNIGSVTALDLQIGLTKTSDGGFAVVSTKQVALLPNCSHPFTPYPSNQCSLSGNIQNVYYKDKWNTNAYIAKFNSAFQFQWDKNIAESTPLASYGTGYNPPISYGNIGDPRLQGDLKREECLYKIIESTTDGGLVVCGNNSNNLDDDVIIKLHSLCQKNVTPDISADLNISTNVTWSNTPKIINATITVQSGGTLTITGSSSVIQFCDTRQVGKPVRIVVQQGGKLIINNGAKLTGILSCPNNTWEGVMVIGNQTQPQFPETNQGVVEITNATVENARNAFTSGAMFYATNAQSILDYSLEMVPFIGLFGGGIIKCNSAIFTNNRTSVRFAPYINFNSASPSVEIANRSFFTMCNFNVGNTMSSFENLREFAYLNGVGGLNFRGCKFENNKTNITELAEMGYGVFSVDAGYNILSNCTLIGPNSCTGEVRSKFKNLEYGVRATRINSTRTFTIDKADFDGSIIAVKNEGISNITVQNSNFSIGNSPIALSTNTGVFIEGNCTGYKITDNTFNRAAVTNNISYSYGVNVANSGTSDTKIERNNYNQLSIANSSAYINKSSTVLSGLQFLCNTYSQTALLDHFVNLNGGGAADGIRSTQGSATAAAGNKFTFPAPSWSTVGHFWNIPNQTITYYWTSQTNEKPTAVSSNVFLPIQNVLTNGCGQSGGGGGGMIIQGGGLTQEQRNGLEFQFASNKQNYNNYLLQLNQLKDGGNSQFLQSEIAFTLSSEAAALRTKLLGESPYLSEATLRELSDKSGVLPDALIFEILAANPDELKNEEFLNYLQQKSNPLPQWMLDMLEQSKGTITSRTILEAGIAYYKDRSEAATQEIIKGILSDDNGVKLNDLRGWLANLNNKEADYEIVASYCQSGDYSSANAFLNTIPQVRSLNEEELIEHESLINVYQIILNAAQSSRGMDSLDESAVVLLTQVADSKPCKAMTMANAILRTYYGRKFDTYPILPEELQSNQLRSAKKDDNKKLNDESGELRVYPNPASDVLIFDYHTMGSITSVSITILDIIGKKIIEQTMANQMGQAVVDISLLPDGLYSYSISSNSFNKFGKFTVSH